MSPDKFLIKITALFMMFLLSIYYVSIKNVNAGSSRSVPKSLKIDMNAKSGSSATGVLELTQQDDGVKITGTITGLTPNQKHGFHIHEKDDCSATDAKSAGGHFNPENHKHGDSITANHAGDLGNITADNRGVANIDQSYKKYSLAARKNTYKITRRSLVIHAKADDLKSQPSGNAGKRVSCGVIE